MGVAGVGSEFVPAGGVPAIVPVEEAASERPADARTPFERRASNVFLLNVLFALIALLVTVGAGSDGTPAVLRVGAGILIVLAGGLAFGLSVALDRGRPWAPAPAAAILWLVALFSLVSALVSLAGGRFTIPIEPFLTLWALSAAGRPSAIPAAPHRRTGWIMIGLFLVTMSGVPVAAAIRSPGTEPFVVGSAALDANLQVGCPAAGAATTSIPVTFAWSWSRRDLVASGTDGAALGVTVADDPGGWRVTGMRATPGFWPGGGDAARNGVTLGDANSAADWGIDVAGSGQLDGFVGVDIVSSRIGVAPATGTLTIQAAYSRDGRWTVEREITCSW